MANQNQFVDAVTKGYQFDGESLVLGAGMLDGKAIQNLLVKLPLRTLNRHGLITGATGTGKTKTFQKLAEGFSQAGIPVLLMDMKGDLSGLAAAGTSNDKIVSRHEQIGIKWNPELFPVEFLTISGEEGVKLRATLSEFGPVLLSKILELNDTQSSVVSLLFKYCDDRGLPLLDLADFKKVLQYLTTDGKAEIMQEYGMISPATMATIMRKIVEIEEQGADIFFGEPSFEVFDLLGHDSRGWGTLNILRLGDIQNQPKMFSTFMLCLLAEIYAKFPEVGDLPKPKLVLFIDEAHVIFNNASSALLEQLETTIKLIRSKGVGVIFCTQNPRDIPQSVLGQLGMKIQHALRAFTAADRKEIALVSQNFPESEFYDVAELITALGTGEALITVLDEKGRPTPLAATLMCTPQSRMDVLTDAEFRTHLSNSYLVGRYSQTFDRQSAKEILEAKMTEAMQLKVEQEQVETVTVKQTTKTEKSTFEKVATSSVAKQVTGLIARELTRSLLGVLGLKVRR